MSAHSRLLLSDVSSVQGQAGYATTANPAETSAAEELAKISAGGGRSERVDRYLARVDRQIADLDDIQRHAFLRNHFRSWETRYARFQRTDGESEHRAPGNPPISSADFLLTLSGLGARIKGWRAP